VYQTAPELRGSRILVIDDDPTLRETLDEVLSDEGYDVRTAAHGLDALDSLDGWPADLIILDIWMPVMDAYDFREQQRMRGVALDSAVLLVSAATNIEDAADAISPTDTLTKPFSLDTMLERVAALVERD
jgi:two-component system response regulator MprA